MVNDYNFEDGIIYSDSSISRFTIKIPRRNRNTKNFNLRRGLREKEKRKKDKIKTLSWEIIEEALRIIQENPKNYHCIVEQKRLIDGELRRIITDSVKEWGV